MAAAGSAAPLVPEAGGLDALRSAAAACDACPLYRLGTQTVFGEGPADAALMLVGEQPGDKEDLAGHPFVGPAGRLLDAALAAAEVDRRGVYVTNAVKHFKWEPRGKRRLHKAPSSREVGACYPWLRAEIQAVRPRLVVTLGATASKALLGRGFKVTERHGEVMEGAEGVAVAATLHPSALLRQRDPAAREARIQGLIDDLWRAARAVGL